MEWILYLLCPLMMLFCMKGMFTGGKKDCLDSKEVHGLQIQMDVLKEQNRKLTEKVQDLSNKAMD